MRIGHGYDVHRFGNGDHILMAGVTIPFHQGLVAQSDGDVLLHALADALLGACALGDIGQHFPDNDDQYENADSRELLRSVYRLVQKQGYQLVNADVTIIAQIPKMAPYNMAMRTNIADDLNISIDQVSIKSTTTEWLGFTGRKEGIAVSAIVLLQ